MKRILFVCFLSLGLSLMTSAAHAQATRTPQLTRLFREVVSKSRQSTLSVLVEGKRVALGVAVSADGWILTKHSELKEGKITCKLSDGEQHGAEMVGFDVPFDLALLKIDVKELKPIEWTESKVSRVGHWVASVGTSEDPVAVGVISVAAREIKGAAKFAVSGSAGGYLGLALDFDFAGVKIQEVLPNTPAQRAGLKTDDQILAVNGEEVQSADDFRAVLSRSKPGDVVKLKISREQKEHALEATLASSPGSKGGKSRGDVQNSMGSKLSERRAGFPFILQHDSVLNPTDCGGPLVNLDGKVVGINICRAGRTESYAIPSEHVQVLIAKLKKGKKTEEK